MLPQLLAALALGVICIGGPLWATRDFPWLGEYGWHGYLPWDAR